MFGTVADLHQRAGAIFIPKTSATPPLAERPLHKATPLRLTGGEEEPWTAPRRLPSAITLTPSPRRRQSLGRPRGICTRLVALSVMGDRPPLSYATLTCLWER
jgi:hypothetical protein